MSTTTDPAPTAGTRMDSGEEIGALATIRLGMKYSPELSEGLRLTLVLAIISSCGQIVVPIAVQQTLDRGLNGPGGPRLDYVAWMGLLAALAIGISGWASYAMTRRLFTTSERGLATRCDVPEEVRAKLSDAVNAALADPAFLEQAEQQALPLSYLSGAEWVEQMPGRLERYTEIFSLIEAGR